MEKVAVQVALFNSSKHLSVLLESLKKQTYQNIDVLLYDNSPSMEERGASRSIAETSGLPHRFIAGTHNIGFAGAHVALYNLQQDPFILLVNDDARLAPDYIERLMERMRTDENIGSSTGLIYRWDERTIDTAGLEYKRLAQIMDRYAGEPAEGKQLEAQEIFGAPGTAPLYRRSAVEKAGSLFDPSWFMYKEDVDLALRLKRAGYNAWFDPKAIAYHKRGIKPKSGLWRRLMDEWDRPETLRMYAYANQLRIYKKHWREVQGLGDVVGSIVVEIMRSAGTFVMSPSVWYRAWKLVLTNHL